jgi:hypothetical protein
VTEWFATLLAVRAADGMVQRTEAQDDLGATGFQAHSRRAQAMVDQTLAGGFGDAWADWPRLDDESGVVHPVRVILERRPGATGGVMGSVRVRDGATVRRLGDEVVEHAGIA